MKKLFVTLFALLAVGFVSAQNEIVVKFNEGVASAQKKEFSKAAEVFEKVIADGAKSTDNNIVTCVSKAKKYLVICYQSLGLSAAAQKKYDEAIAHLTKASDKAKLFKDNTSTLKADALLAKVYQVQGGEAFNAKDYATAAEVFKKGYAANNRNTEMGLNLATCYCELGKFEEGMKVYDEICALTPADKYADAINKATANKALYTKNQVATLQKAKNYDAVIAMYDRLAQVDPASAEKVRIEAYSAKGDFNKVIELGENAATAQTTNENRSSIYFTVAAAYNALYNKGGNKDTSLRDKAIAAFKKVTAGANVATAKAALAKLQK